MEPRVFKQISIILVVVATLVSFFYPLSAVFTGIAGVVVLVIVFALREHNRSPAAVSTGFAVDCVIVGLITSLFLAPYAYDADVEFARQYATTPFIGVVLIVVGFALLGINAYLLKTGAGSSVQSWKPAKSKPGLFSSVEPSRTARTKRKIRVTPELLSALEEETEPSRHPFTAPPADALPKLQKLVKISSRVKIGDMATMLGMKRDELLERLIDWADELNFMIEEEVVVFDAGRVDDFIERLDEEFAQWAGSTTKI
ncbi:MAG: hypothetical protein ACTSU5_16605 [Promethearchaeota archaeon]